MAGVRLGPPGTGRCRCLSSTGGHVPGPGTTRTVPAPLPKTYRDTVEATSVLTLAARKAQTGSGGFHVERPRWPMGRRLHPRSFPWSRHGGAWAAQGRARSGAGTRRGGTAPAERSPRWLFEPSDGSGSCSEPCGESTPRAGGRRSTSSGEIGRCAGRLRRGPPPVDRRGIARAGWLAYLVPCPPTFAWLVTLRWADPRGAP